MTLYEQISIIIFLGMFSLLVKDSIESARQRRFYREGYEEEKKRRVEYRKEKLTMQSNLAKWASHFHIEYSEDINRIISLLKISTSDHTDLQLRGDKINHDLQQIKTRLTWSKKREKKDLKNETKLSHKTKVVKFKKRK